MKSTGGSKFGFDAQKIMKFTQVFEWESVVEIIDEALDSKCRAASDDNIIHINKDKESVLRSYPNEEWGITFGWEKTKG